MVSTRPSPNPAKGRVAYPSADAYVPGDVDTSPTLLGSSPIQKVTSSDSQVEKSQNLKAWWKGFRERTDVETTSREVFGVPLSESIQYASVQISTAGSDGRLYVWGYIPIVVAKCGLYLKETATETEGAFRISGSTKRMRELQTLFETGPKYGKNIDWKTLSFTAHDVATIFRRFLTQMPESIIPLDFYESFREALVDTTESDAIRRYKELIRAMPSVNQYLLLYVLDLLSVFARKSDVNLMTAPNLALIFQPGVLSHPQHDMRPREHVLSQQVLEFLIEHQDNFLVGMQLVSAHRRVLLRQQSKRRRGKDSRALNSPEAFSVKSPQPNSLPPLKADEETMLPSDSDDEAPEGGYYIIEGTHRAQSPSGTPALPSSSTSPVLDVLLPPKPSTIRRVIPQQSETMEPSDSDEEAPPGGYEVRVADPEEVRATLLARSRSRVEKAQRRNGASTDTTSNLSRRQTMPSRASVYRKQRGIENKEV